MPMRIARCSRAKTKVVHVGFEDPPRLTSDLPDGEAKLAVYRRVRDEIRRFVETLPEALKSEGRNPTSEGRPKAGIRNQTAKKCCKHEYKD